MQPKHDDIRKKIQPRVIVILRGPHVAQCNRNLSTSIECSAQSTSKISKMTRREKKQHYVNNNPRALIATFEQSPFVI